jgi:hypothetical protein
MPCKYFEVDPLVDPPLLQPGWVSSVEASLTRPVVKNHLNNQVAVGQRGPDLVQLPVSNLDTTVMPRLEVGYRLPTGFGEITLSYRGLASSGHGTIQPALPAGTFFPDTLAPFRSRLDFNIIDLDYVSREWALGPCWRMDWRFGVRLVYVYFDSQASQPFDAAAAGTGILSQQVTNQHWGVGPHCGLELSRKLPWAGLEVVGSAEVSGVFGRVKQGYYESALDVNGLPTFGGQTDPGSQPMAIARGRLGVSWQPPACCPMFRLFAGYEFEYWWEVGRLGNLVQPIPPTGEIWNQGLVVRAQMDW